MNGFIVQIPDVRTGDDIIDAVIVDKESVGSEGCGCGAKILYGKGALDRYFALNKAKDSQVCSFHLCKNPEQFFFLFTRAHRHTRPLI